MSDKATTHLNLVGKCGSCKFAHFNEERYPCWIVCEKMSPRNNTFRRSRAGCPHYQFDKDKICECGETIENWYNFCPTCGQKVEWKGADNEQRAD
jgi:hypothetical protein